MLVNYMKKFSRKIKFEFFYTVEKRKGGLPAQNGNHNNRTVANHRHFVFYDLSRL